MTATAASPAGLHLLDTTMLGIPLSLYGETFTDGHQVTAVYLPCDTQRTHNLLELFPEDLLQDFDRLCDATLGSHAEQVSDYWQDRRFEERRDARL